MRFFLYVIALTLLASCQPTPQNQSSTPIEETQAQEKKPERPKTFSNFLEDSMWVDIYQDKEYLPIINTGDADFFEKDPLQKKIRLSRLSFVEKTTTDYYFVKKEDDWSLQKKDSTSLYTVADIDFLEFLETFSRDTAFQKYHVNFPMPYSYADVQQNYETISDTLQIEEWEHLFLIREIEGLMMLGAYDTSSDTRVIHFRGLDNGIKVFFYFEKKENNWKLAKMEDLST